MKHLENMFFRKTALADQIFTLDEGVQLFWAAFDPILAVVLLKVALGLQIFYFWAFQKIIMRSHLVTLGVIIFFK